MFQEELHELRVSDHGRAAQGRDPGQGGHEPGHLPAVGVAEDRHLGWLYYGPLFWGYLYIFRCRIIMGIQKTTTRLHAGEPATPERQGVAGPRACVDVGAVCQQEPGRLQGRAVAT